MVEAEPVDDRKARRRSRGAELLDRHAILLALASGSGLMLVVALVLAREDPALLLAYGSSTAFATVVALVALDRGVQLQLTPETPLRALLRTRIWGLPLLAGGALAYAALSGLNLPMAALAAAVVGATTLRDAAALRLAGTAPYWLVATAIAKAVTAAALLGAAFAFESTAAPAVAALAAHLLLDLLVVARAAARPDPPGARELRPGRVHYAFAPAVGAAVYNVDLLLIPYFLDDATGALYVLWSRVVSVVLLPADAAGRRILARVREPGTGSAPMMILAGTGCALVAGVAVIASRTTYAAEVVVALGLLSLAAGLRAGNFLLGASLTRADRQQQRFRGGVAALTAAVIMNAVTLPLIGLPGAAAARLAAESTMRRAYRRAAEGLL